MFKIVLLSVMLLQLASTLRIATTCSLSSGLDPNVEGEFGDSDVKEMHGSRAIVYLKADHKLPLLVLAYHPQCPHCQALIKPYKRFAEKVGDEDKPKVKVVAINMSKTDPGALKVTGFPTVRLYRDGDYKNYELVAGKDVDFGDFLAEHGIDIE